jgi:hypothetical protein
MASVLPQTAKPCRVLVGLSWPRRAVRLGSAILGGPDERCTSTLVAMDAHVSDVGRCLDRSSSSVFLMGDGGSQRLPVLGDAKYARQESDKAWDRNLDCLTNIEHIKPNANTKYVIDLVPCPSGDILVTLTPLQSPGTHISRWIVTTDFFSDVAQFSLVGTAAAQDSSAGSPNPVRIIGIKKSGSVVTKRVQFPDNSCADQTIDSYTGRQLNQQKASCSPF